MPSKCWIRDTLSRRKRSNTLISRKIPSIGLPNILASFDRSEEHTSELQSQSNLVCRLLLEKKKKQTTIATLAGSWVPITQSQWTTPDPTVRLSQSVRTSIPRIHLDLVSPLSHRSRAPATYV